jgi:asparagine synthase (glutamine-hydrolysing)
MNNSILVISLKHNQDINTNFIMCGIYGCFHDGNAPKYQYSCIKPRGPDETVVIDDGDGKHLAFYRLKVVGISDGSQPYQTDDLELMCNGEIYNHTYLKNLHEFKMKTHSDCEIILHMYRKFGIERTVRELHGEFAFILVDKEQRVVHFARDRFGVKPLYMSNHMVNSKMQSLEVASIPDSFAHKTGTQHVLPGEIYTFDLEHRTISSQPYCVIQYGVNKVKYTSHDIYKALVQSIKMRIEQSERAVGFLLSGGLDSSIVLSIALNEYKFIKPVEVFTFAFEPDAPDVKAARIMVEFYKKTYGNNCINWHLVIRPVIDGVNVFPSVIKALGTFDTTTVRASVPMYLISKYIAENTNVRVLLSGEGADELFGGYLYMKYAPNDFAYRAEILKLLRELYMFDCARADRTTSSHGLEVRPPFLDQVLVYTVLNSDNLLKCDYSTTKPVLRQIASDYALLPASILVGKKEAFSDAVGLSWQESMARCAREMIKKDNYANVEYSPIVPPISDTSKVFQMIFSRLFGPLWHLVPKMWMPNQEWVDTGGEPSARVLECYDD